MEVAVEATGAMAMITTTAAGKQDLLELGNPSLVLDLLDCGDMRMMRNVLNTIANAAELPRMRNILKVDFTRQNCAAPCSVAVLMPAATRCHGTCFMLIQDILQEAGIMHHPALNAQTESATIQRAWKSALQQCAFQHRPIM
jgi:hypothetical protein